MTAWRKHPIIGLSKINRIVRFFGQRPQVQERLTRQILMDSNSQTSTTALGGCFKDNIHTRAEFLNP